jgi:MFS family permease
MPGLRRYILRLRSFLGLERNIIVMMVAGILQGLGLALWSGYMPKFLQALGAGGVVIGTFGTIGSLLWVVFPYVGGVLSDRLGRTRVLVLGGLLAAAGYVNYMVAPTWWFLLPGLVLTTAAASFGFMGSMALTGDAVRSQRRATSMTARGLLGSLPALVGPPLGGLLIVHVGLVRGVRMCLLITVVFTLAAVWVQHRFYRLRRRPEQTQQQSPSSFWRAAPSALKQLLAADCLLRFGDGMSAMFVVLYVLDVLGASELDFGLLMSLQTILFTLLALPTAKLTDRGGPRTRRPIVAATFFLFAVFPLALVLIPSARWLVAVFVIGGLRHVGEPTRKALIVDLAEGPHRGRLIGMYHTLRGAVVLPSALIGGLLWERLPAAPFLVGSGISALGLAWFLLARPRQGS